MAEEPEGTQNNDEQKESGVSAVPIVIVIVLFVVFAGVFLFEMANLSDDDGGVAAEDVSADSYMDTVADLMTEADPANGPALVAKHGCTACHGNGARAPEYQTIRQMAAERRPPMTAAAYVYESIIYPGAYRVDGYPNNMPRTYEDSIPEDELADMVAWLSVPMEEQAALDVTAEPTPEETPEPETASDEPTPYPLTDELIEDYETNAGFLLTGSNPARGEELVEEYGCNACHGEANAGVVGPGHDQVAEMAGQRREGLSAAAYVYEAILYPDRHIVDGWSDIMPKNYDERLESGDLGDIMAYLLQQDQD